MTAFLKKIIPVCSLLLLGSVLLSGCGCDHEWQRATCQAPRTCSLCGETEGKVRSHEWASTDCRAPEGCIVCGTLEEIELTHEWQADCKICVYCGHDARPAEDRFPDQLAAGLEARWQLEETLYQQEDYVLTKEEWTACFDAEYQRLSTFRQEKFQDKAMKEAAERYISCLEDSYKALDFFGTDKWADEYHNSVYQAQTLTLLEISELHTITVSEAYGERLEQMLTNGQIIRLVSPLFDQVLFLHISTSGNTHRYETTIKNDTSLTFRWFSFDVELQDENGKLLATETVKVNNWKPDEKRRFTLTTEEEFAAINVTFADWELPR